MDQACEQGSHDSGARLGHESVLLPCMPPSLERRS